MDKNALTDILTAHPEIAAAILFGSQASGQATKDSDIDIALLYDREKIPSTLDFFHFKDELSDQMHQDVDLVLLNSASPIICMQAVKNGIPLLIKDKKAYDAFEMRLITDYADLKRLQEPFEKNILKRKLK